MGMHPFVLRLYSLSRLIRHWTAMRWDDTMVVVHPSLLARRARDLFGLLEGNKVSGPSEKVVTLPVFFSDEAVLVHRRIYPGFGPLKKDFGYERNYLLRFATEGFKGCIQRRRVQRCRWLQPSADASALRAEPDIALLTPGTAAFLN